MRRYDRPFYTEKRQICAELEALEREAPANLYAGEAGQFVFEDWQRAVENGGGGTGGMLRGRLFERRACPALTKTRASGQQAFPSLRIWSIHAYPLYI